MTSKIKVDNITNQSDSNIVNKCGTTITLGASGDTVNLASGASQTGFGRTGTVDWQTGSIKTGTFTAVNGEGYFIDTSSGVSTANLPAGSAGAIVSFADYTRTFQTNNLTITPNGSEKIGGVAANFVAQTEGQSITLVYVDATEGWINTAESTGQSGLLPTFITATGGTITTVDTDYKVHTFTGPGTFTVCSVGNPIGSNTVDYMVIAGGGGGANANFGVPGGAGGAGGFREGYNPSSYTASPLATTALPVTATGFPITVGGGGGACTSGSNSTFSSITSAGGGSGGGGSQSSCAGDGANGGSGGGGGSSGTNPAQNGSGGTGNTPPVSPSQGNNGGGGFAFQGHSFGSGAGGGATAAGGGGGPATGGTGGAGATSSINGTPTGRAGGGGGAGRQPLGGCGTAGPASDGGGAGGNASGGQQSGTTNTGGGGGGTACGGAGSGGSGIVIIRYKFQ